MKAWMGGALAVLLCGAEAHAQPADPGSTTRVRGGVTAGVGFLDLSGLPVQPVFGLTGRVGFQINDLFSIYYQNTLAEVSFTDGTGFALFSYNALLGGLTLGHLFDAGFGPSLDVLYVSPSSGPSSVGLLPGLHGRGAFLFGGSDRHGVHRRGVSLGAETHASFGQGVALTACVAAGYEWF